MADRDLNRRGSRALVPLAASLGAANVLAWLWAAASLGTSPAMMGTAALAYGLGLRHAVDADHIAAIDNVTRQLRQQGRRSTTVGLFFSLGHSTVVLLATIGIVLSATAFRDRFDEFRLFGSTVATLVSALFLFAIALINFGILIGTWRTLGRLRAGGPLDAPLLLDGPLNRLLRPAMRLIRRSWHMYPLGFLFGLGFDTASEIGLLGMSAAEAAHGMPLWSILVLPALFAAGMSAIDTADGVLMLYAYDWAFIRPQRKLYYNLAITAASVAVALLVGGVELLGMIGDRLGLQGAVWDQVAALNGHMGLLGYGIIAFFALLWGGAALMLGRGRPTRA